jgi:hypothetical protein
MSFQIKGWKTALNIHDLNRFQEEIKVTIPSITTVLMDNEGNGYFQSETELTAQNKVDIDSFISNFVDSDPEQKIPRIIDLAKGEAKKKHFHNIIYTSNKELISSMIPVRTKVKGEVREVTWYKTLDENQVPVEPVIKVEISYTRDSSGFALFRNTARTYYNRDGSENPEVKYSQKFYFINKGDMIVEGYKRRKLLVQEVQIPSLEYITTVLMPLGYSETACLLRGRAFMDNYEELFNKFVENSSTVTDPADPNFGKKSIVVALEDNTTNGINGPHNEWLDKAPPQLGGLKTIRQWLIEEFSI